MVGQAFGKPHLLNVTSSPLVYKREREVPYVGIFSPTFHKSTHFTLSGSHNPHVDL